jgi:hypothetical protein
MKESLRVINPDPSKYAMCESGLQLLPKQCPTCFDLFTPVAGAQNMCESCGGPVVPDAMPDVIINYPEATKPPSKQPKYRTLMCRTWKLFDKCRKEGNLVEAAKWDKVSKRVSRLCRDGVEFKYNDVVKSIFEEM